MKLVGAISAPCGRSHRLFTIPYLRSAFEMSKLWSAIVCEHASRLDYSYACGTDAPFGFTGGASAAVYKVIGHHLRRAGFRV